MYSVLISDAGSVTVLLIYHFWKVCLNTASLVCDISFLLTSSEVFHSDRYSMTVDCMSVSLWWKWQVGTEIPTTDPATYSGRVLLFYTFLGYIFSLFSIVLPTIPHRRIHVCEASFHGDFSLFVLRNENCRFLSLTVLIRFIRLYLWLYPYNLKGH